MRKKIKIRFICPFMAIQIAATTYGIAKKPSGKQEKNTGNVSIFAFLRNTFLLKHNIIIESQQFELHPL